MTGTKIQFSKQELELFSDSALILTKNSILEKLQQLLGELQLRQKAIIEKSAALLPEEVLNTSAKISKGENYKGLPWLMLDYPRYFVQENIFAIRTMFWWGNFFSTTLHLSGRFKAQFQDQIFSSLKELAKHNFLICKSESQWHHSFEDDNYQLLQDITKEETLQLKVKSFLKLAKKIPLQHSEEAALLLTGDYKMLVNLFRF